MAFAIPFYYSLSLKSAPRFRIGSTFFFEKKVAKKQKSLQDLSGLSLLLHTKTSRASPSGNFAPAKFTRNHGAFLLFANFSLSAKWCIPIIKNCSRL